RAQTDHRLQERRAIEVDENGLDQAVAGVAEAVERGDDLLRDRRLHDTEGVVGGGWATVGADRRRQRPDRLQHRVTVGEGLEALTKRMRLAKPIGSLPVPQ